MNFTSVKVTAGKITLKVRMETLYNSIYSKFQFHIHLKDIVGDFTGNILFQIISRKESKKKEFNSLKNLWQHAWNFHQWG